MQQGVSAEISVNGNANLVAGRDVIQIITTRPKFTIVLQRDDGHIDDAQAATLKRLVRALVEGSAQGGIAPLSYAEVWTTLNDKMHVPSYRLTPASRFLEAQTFLTQWRDRLATARSDDMLGEGEPR
jgi:hypothetical protein